jgi:tight adherence protein B
VPVPLRRAGPLLGFSVGAVMSAVAARPRRAVALTVAGCVALGWLAGGFVAAVLAAIYSALTARAVLRRHSRSRAGLAHARSLDDLAALAADLRAGLPPAVVLSAGGAQAGPGISASAELRVAELTAAVWRLAERTGAPAAELVERIEADARAADRAQASAAAQAAGAQATALLLAALPLGGIALGYGIGVAPLRILLHTALGGACAIVAALLQSVGLIWADRLATGPTR